MQQHKFSNPKFGITYVVWRNSFQPFQSQKPPKSNDLVSFFYIPLFRLFLGNQMQRKIRSPVFLSFSWQRECFAGEACHVEINVVPIKIASKLFKVKKPIFSLSLKGHSLPSPWNGCAIGNRTLISSTCLWVHSWIQWKDAAITELVQQTFVGFILFLDFNFVAVKLSVSTELHYDLAVWMNNH